MTSQTVNVQLPRFFVGFTKVRGNRAFQHARLDCRILETFTALAFQALMKGRNNVVLVTSGNAARIRFLLGSWFNEAKEKPKRFSTVMDKAKFNCFTLNGSDLWLVDTRELYSDDLPFKASEIGEVYSIGSEGCKTDLSILFEDARLTLSGELANRNDWFFAYCLREDVTTFKADDEEIVTAFPDQEGKGLPKNDPYFERVMKLKDVEPRFGASSFLTFSKRRLHIRTDKPIDFLTQRQQDQAKDQYGVPIVSFDSTKLQRRYLAQKRLAVAKGHKPWYLLLKYRRGGFTSIEQGISYQFAATYPRSQLISVAHTNEATKRIFRIASLFHEKDPLAPKRVSNSLTSLEFNNGSYFFIGTAGGLGVSRGDTLQRVHGSEVAKWLRGPNQLEKVQDLGAGLFGAASNGEVVLETTPNGREWFCLEYELAKRGQSEFYPIFLRWFDDPLNRALPGTFNVEEILDTLSDEEKMLVELHGLTIDQLAFRRSAKRVYKQLFPQEMPEDDVTCFLTSGISYFDTDVVLGIMERLEPIKFKLELMKLHHPGGYEIRWEKPKPGEIYVAGCDTSEGLPGCDNSGVGILNKRTGKQVAALHGLFNPRTLADHAVRMCKAYNNALLGVERENHGHAVIQRVVDVGYSRPHFRGGPLYYFHQGGTLKNSRAGWSTNPQSRPLMLDELASKVEDDPLAIRDLDFCEEMLSFRLQSNGKFEADTGAHDDTVMKWAIAEQMRKYHKPKPQRTIIS